MFLENTTKFLRYYGKGKYLKLGAFFVMSLISGLFELLGVALIYPFIMIIVNPEIMDNYVIYNNIVEKFPNFTPYMFIALVGLSIFGVFITKNIFMILILKFQTSFTNNWKRDITKMIMKYYTFGTYKDLMKITSGEKMFYISNVIPNVIDGFIVRVLNIIINFIIITMILGFLAVKFPLAAIVTCSFVIISMTIQNKLFKKRTLTVSEKIKPAQKKYNKILIENLTNIKGVKILSAENLFYNRYEKSENELRQIQIEQQFYMLIPPYIVECLVILSVLVLGGIIALQSSGGNLTLVASFALIAAALFRVAPALNRIQSAIININTMRTFVQEANKKFEQLKPNKLLIKENSKIPAIRFENSIELKNVCFSYDEKEVLHNVNLKINKGEFVGIVGLSGAGKSTIADILTGLLPINSGEIIVDNKALNNKEIVGLRKITGYVPQETTVFEMSFKENVTWGCEAIDENRVKDVLKKVNLMDLIQENYADGIEAKPFIGTNGLSQGQKQRLAIARALYRNPELILLDEATSSLDVVCENEITEVLNKLKGDKTIIAIAHRLSTLKTCSKIIYVKDGQVLDTGSFEQLSAKWPEFDKIVKLSKIETN